MLHDLMISRHQSERGAALFIALGIILILTLLGFGLLARASWSSRIAGQERWPVKAFYAADSGINLASLRLRKGRLSGFEFQIPDFRGKRARATGAPIQVRVEPIIRLGPPPSEDPEGAAGAELPQPALMEFFRVRSHAIHPETGSRCDLTVILSMSPLPPGGQEHTSRRILPSNSNDAPAKLGYAYQ